MKPLLDHSGEPEEVADREVALVRDGRLEWLPSVQVGILIALEVRQEDLGHDPAASVS
jgi:hypothetical protein